MRGLRWLVLAAILVVAGWVGEAHLRAASMLLRAEGQGARASGVAAYRELAVTTRPWQGGVLYEPEGVSAAPALLLVHGVHRLGPDEPRQVAFARAVASAGVAVATPRIDGLSRYAFDGRDVVAIRDLAGRLAEQRGVGSVAVFGISIGGGLALRAACEQGAAGPIAAVIALGPHHDLRRVARFYLGEGARGPAGESSHVQPNPYGLGVTLLRFVDDVFPGHLRSPARALLLRQLADERLRPADVPDPALAPLLARRPPEPLRERLLRLVERDAGAFDRVSPSACRAPPRVPVHLVHGSGDSIVPATETAWLAAQMGDAQLVQVLVSDAIGHADYSARSPWQRLQLVHFMARVLASL